VTRIDPSVVSLVAKLGGPERQADHPKQRRPNASQNVVGRDLWESDPRRGKGSFPILQGRRDQGSGPGYVTPANQRMTPSAAITGGMGISQQLSVVLLSASNLSGSSLTWI
jgi:hypothetical protein